MTSIIDSLNKPNQYDNDYFGSDGLLYCGKCHTRKQMYGSEIGIGGKKLSVLCHCEEVEATRNKAEEEQKRVDELRSVCLPVSAMHKHTFAVASSEKHIETAKRYVEKWDLVRKKNLGLMFWGNTGTGKSFTAHCIANALIDKSIPIKLISSIELIAKLMDKELPRECFIDSLCKIPLLIIDDVGAERDTPFSREQLCSVIDARSEAARPLIVTTNYSLNEMDECTDHQLQRTFNRIKACCVPIAVVGDSRRNIIADKKLKELKNILGL